jgi:hypothetical protein
MDISPTVRTTTVLVSRILDGMYGNGELGLAFSFETDWTTRELILNGLSLACGFAGNVFLLLNFTGVVRYIIALPLSIIFWVLASGIVSLETLRLLTAGHC